MGQRALIFDIKRGSSEDGPGIRTTVFFKGCPLACVWCQNPEGIAREPGTDINGDPVGFWIGLEELLYRVRQDRPFYDSSGGGVTLSGGEPTVQMDFNQHFLKMLKEEGIHTAMETCGLFHYDGFRRKLLPWLDLIYFDLKLIDDGASRRYAGCPSAPVLENFSRLLREAEIPVIPRIPLIPGITATRENLSGLARFLRERNVDACTLIPYNPLWRDKLKRLGIRARYDYSTYMPRGEQELSISYFNEAR